MPESYSELVNRILRDHEGYTGDGRGGVGALPIGDRSTARKGIDKADLRTVMLSSVSSGAIAEAAADAAATSAAQAALYDGPWVQNVTALLDDTALTYSAGQPGAVAAGQIVRTRAEGFAYEVVASSAMLFDLVTAGGVKLRLVPKGDASDLMALGFDKSGSADMSALLTAYLARMPAIVVKLPGGRVRLDSPVEVPPYTALDLGNTVFDLTHLASGQPAFRARGTVVRTTNVVAGGSAGSTAIFVEDAEGIIPGTVLKIRSNEIFDPARTNSRFGELVRVKAVSDTELTLHVPLFDVYRTAEEARVEVLNPVRQISIVGPATFLAGNSGNRKAILFDKAVDCTILNVVFRNFDDRALWLQDCDNVNGDNLTFEDFNSPGTGYGVSCVDATQNCLFRGLHGRRVRHLFATNNTSAGGGIPRNITVDGFSVDASAFAFNGPDGVEGSGGDAMDTHAASEMITFKNGVITGATGIGIMMEGAGGVIENVRIVRPASHGVYAANFSGRLGRIRIVNVDVIRPGQSGVRVSANGSGFISVDISASVERANSAPAIFFSPNEGRRYRSVNINAKIWDCDREFPVHLCNVSGALVSIIAAQAGLDRGCVRIVDAVGLTLDVVAEGAFEAGKNCVRIERSSDGVSRNVLVRPNIRSSTDLGTGVRIIGDVTNCVVAADRIIDNFATDVLVG